MEISWYRNYLSAQVQSGKNMTLVRYYKELNTGGM